MSNIFTAEIERAALGENDSDHTLVQLVCSDENIHLHFNISIESAREYPIGSKVMVTVEPIVDAS